MTRLIGGTKVKLDDLSMYLFGRRGADLRRSPNFVGWVAIGVEILIVLPAAILYMMNTGERAKERQYQAWQVINAADGKKWGGGRASALQDLSRDRVPLRAMDLSGAFLQGLSLPNADLKFARLDAADLVGADLHGARMARTGLRGTNLGASRLRDAEFAFADARNARFDGARLCGAVFIGADLRGASFRRANLRGARFDGADLRGAEFSLAGLPPGSTFHEANVDGIRAPESFVRQARAMGAVTQPQALWDIYRHGRDEDWRDRWAQQDARRIRRGASFWRTCPALERPRR